MLFLIAGKLNYREYIVITRYNGIGNDKRDMHSERMSVMARKVKSVFNTNVVRHMVKAYVQVLWIRD